MALAQEKQPAMNTLPRDILAGWKILVIDDEHDSADVATRVLRYYGADVSIACNGLEGLDLVQRTHPRLVICDISMPVLDGWGVIRKLKNERSLMDIPVIALTAHAMTGDRQRAIAAGFHNYLSKPLTPFTFTRDLLILLVDLPQFAGLREKLG
jgi:two-component system, cell cycle response regulator DivK